jgi:hypothetical protein
MQWNVWEIISLKYLSVVAGQIVAILFSPIGLLLLQYLVTE